MPLKIYLPNGDEATWESEMLKVSKATSECDCGYTNASPTSKHHIKCNVFKQKADHQGERLENGPYEQGPRMSIDDRMKQIFPRLPHEVGDAAIEAAKVKYYREQDVKPEAPAHYAKGGIETIDYIRAKLSPEEYCGYCRGNVMKYISRYTEKGGLDDLRKLMVYAGWLVEAYEKRLVFPHKVVE